MNKPDMNYDQANDILYIVIREGEEHRFREVAEGIVVEFDEDNQPIGIEIDHASQVMTRTIGRERIAPRIEQDLVGGPTRRRSLLGLWTDLANAPSVDEIDQSRREMWKNFPREDIA